MPEPQLNSAGQVHWVPYPTLDRRSSELNGRLVIEAEVQSPAPFVEVRPGAARRGSLNLRPESRYHRLVFTVPEWDRFLADVKTGRCG